MQEEKYAKKRLRSAYITTVVSISLVLYLLGIVALIVLNAKNLSDHIKENIGFNIILKDSAKEVEIVKLQKTLDAQPYTKETRFISKEEAAEILKRDLGEDFISFLGYNPLSASIDLHLKAEYAVPDSVEWIEKDILKHSIVKEVYYQKSLIQKVNENVKKISLFLLGFSALLLIISIALINNAIRLAIYSKRFLIRTMQLVGASPGFIRRPFIWKGIVNGIYGSVIAIILISLTIYYVQQQVPDFFQIKDLKLYAEVFGVILLLGILITWISTFFAVHRFIRMRPEKIY
ncbi:MAG: FtsX-like permease family protein [Bacteroidetes bacterium]|nr:MAG: FtsX-like permease family protein [Bacteroidota bacterium]